MARIDIAMELKKPMKHLLFAMALGCSFLYANDQKEYTLEPMVVYGDKLGRSLHTLPQSVGILDEIRLQTEVPLNANSLLDRFANTYTGVESDSPIVIRGVGNDSVAPAGFDRSNGLASVFYDQAPLSLSRLDYFKPITWDAKELSLFRGPVSTSYGPYSLIGAVIIDYNEPNFSHDGRIGLSYSSFNTQEMAITQNLPLIPDKLAIRLNAQTHVSDGTVDNITIPTDNWDDSETNEFRGQFLWQPLGTNEFTVEGFVDYVKTNTLPFYYNVETSALDLFERKNTANVTEETKANTSLSYVKTTWELDDSWTFESISSFNYFDAHDLTDFDLSALPLVEDKSFTEENRFDQEFRWHYKNRDTNFLIGTYYQYQYFEFGFDGNVLPGLGLPLKISSSTVTRVETVALFGEASQQINDCVNIEAGLRLNYDERLTRNTNIRDSAGGRLVDREQNLNLLPRASITLSVNDTLNIGALVSRGYRSGGVSSVLLQSNVTAYDPEFAWNYETFLRYRADDGLLNIHGNFYYIDWRNQQVSTTLPFGFPGIDDVIVNTGKSRLYGAELESWWELNKSFEVYAAVGYQFTEFIDFQTGGQNFTGDRFTNAPRWNWALGGTLWLTPQCFASSTLTWQDQTYSTLGQNNVSRLEERLLLSAKLGITRNRWTVYIFGENLLDRDYAINRFLSFGQRVGQPGLPRTVGVGIELGW